jgi:hypothetical protein
VQTNRVFSRGEQKVKKWKQSPSKNPPEKLNYPFFASTTPFFQLDCDEISRKLKSFDATSKSDPYVVVSMCDPLTPNSTFVEIARTETIQYQIFSRLHSRRFYSRDNNNPVFKQKITLEYFFERSQKLHFQVYDHDAHHSDFIGDVFCELSEIVTARGQTLTKPIK